MSKENISDNEETKALSQDAVMPRFSVSLVYVKNIPNGYQTALRVLIVYAISSEEALGKTILYYNEEMKDFNLSNKIIIRINEA